MLYFFQEKLIFQPTQLEPDHQFEFEHDFEEFFLDSADGATINSLYFKAENPVGSILYFHGNAGDLQRWGQIVSYFVDMAYNVYIMDYRTYGKSRGKLSEQAMYQDADLVYAHVKQLTSEEQLTVYGRSLGSAFATHVASQNQPKQLILEAPFYSIADVAKNRFPIFPVKPLLKFRFKNYERMTSVNCPVTIIHGTDDYVVPISSGKKLFEQVPIKTATFVEVKDGGHNDLVEYKTYQNAIKKCLKE